MPVYFKILAIALAFVGLFVLSTHSSEAGDDSVQNTAFGDLQAVIIPVADI